MSREQGGLVQKHPLQLGETKAFRLDVEEEKMIMEKRLNELQVEALQENELFLSLNV